MIPPAALHVVDLSHFEMKKPSAIPFALLFCNMRLEVTSSLEFP